MILKSLVHGCAEELNVSVRDLSACDIEDIDACILIVVATWSGQSVAALRMLSHELLRLRQRPPLVVCDADHLSPEDVANSGALSGYGETFWIKNGRVTASLLRYDSRGWRDIVAHHTEKMMFD